MPSSPADHADFQQRPNAAAGEPAAEDRPWPRRAVYLALYLLLVAGVTWGMSRGRQWAIASYQGQDAQADWEQWRDEARKQADGEGPVSRKVPTSAEPPALVLMRDYYWQCLIGALLVSSALAFSMIFLFGGMLRQPAWQPLEDPDA